MHTMNTLDHSHHRHRVSNKSYTLVCIYYDDGEYQCGCQVICILSTDTWYMYDQLCKYRSCI